MSDRVPPKVALTIAGTDSGGGAGVGADLKTFEAFGVWGTCAVVAVTAQNTLGVTGVQTMAPRLVGEQVAAVATDIGVHAAKTGMLATAELVDAVAKAVSVHEIGPLVVDPVAVSTTGHRLIDEDAVEVVVRHLMPLATVITPNTEEAAVLTGLDQVHDRETTRRAAALLLERGARHVLITGGHRRGDPADLLAGPDGEVWLEGAWLDAAGAHGGGCTLSAAITARLALGDDVEAACRAAKAHVTEAIRHGVAVGGGARPVDPGWRRGRPS